MTKKLTKRELATHLKTIGTAWDVSSDGTLLVRTFTFSRFIEAFMFVARIGIHAEVLQQYPRIVLDRHKVVLTLSDFDRELLTINNFELAHKIDVIFALSTSTARRRM